jgi:hypothetical protein
MSITKHIASRHVSAWKKISCAGLAGALVLATGAVDASAAPAAKPAATSLKQADTSKWKPKLYVKPPVSAQFARHAIAGGVIGTTVPYWTTSITSPMDGNTYTVSMVGSSPYAANPQNTNVTYVPIALRIHIGGFVIDPTAVSHCDTQSAARRFFNSPLFRPTQFTSNGVNVSNIPGGTQLISAFQRANFWNAVKGTSYGVTLIPSRLDPIVVDWTPTDPLDFVAGVPDNCGGTQPVPVVSINEFDTELQASRLIRRSTPMRTPATAVFSAITTPFRSRVERRSMRQAPTSTPTACSAPTSQTLPSGRTSSPRWSTIRSYSRFRARRAGSTTT